MLERWAQIAAILAAAAVIVSAMLSLRAELASTKTLLEELPKRLGTEIEAATAPLATEIAGLSKQLDKIDRFNTEERRRLDDRLRELEKRLPPKS